MTTFDTTEADMTTVEVRWKPTLHPWVEVPRCLAMVGCSSSQELTQMPTLHISEGGFLFFQTFLSILTPKFGSLPISGKF